MPETALTSLSHHIDLDWMREAYRRTRKDGAVGIDGQSAKEFEANLEENLEELLTLAKSGRYRAPAVRRVHNPKGDGRASPDRNPDVRGQGAPTRNHHGAGAGIRAELSRLLVRVPSGPFGARGAPGTLERNDADGRRVGAGCRHPELLR